MEIGPLKNFPLYNSLINNNLYTEVTLLESSLWGNIKTLYCLVISYCHRCVTTGWNLFKLANLGPFSKLGLLSWLTDMWQRRFEGHWVMIFESCSLYGSLVSLLYPLPLLLWSCLIWYLVILCSFFDGKLKQAQWAIEKTLQSLSNHSLNSHQRC